MTEKNIKIGAGVNDAGFKKLQETLKKSKKDSDELGKSIKSINQEFKTLDKEIQGRVKAVEKLAGAFKALKSAITGNGIINVPSGGQPQNSFNNQFNNKVVGGGRGAAGGIPATQQGPNPWQPPIGSMGQFNWQNVGPQSPNSNVSNVPSITRQQIGQGMQVVGGVGTELADFIKGFNTNAEVGLANIAGTRNRMFDRLMGHDISDAYVGRKNYLNRGKDRNIRGNQEELDFMDYVKTEGKKKGGAWETAGNAIAEGMAKSRELRKEISSAVGAETQVQKYSTMAGKLALERVSMGGQVLQGVGDLLTAKNLGAGTITGGAALGAKTLNSIGSYSDWQGAAKSAETLSDADKQLSHQQIRLMQNFIDKAGMVLQGDLRLGGRGVNMMSRGAGAGMMGGEAISFGSGVANRFGQGMGNSLINFGLNRRMVGGDAGLMAGVAGQAGFGLGDNISNESRSQRGIKAITDAIALGASKGMSDPQSMEALSTAVANAISRYGGSGAGVLGYATSGMDSANFNPLMIQERMQALQSFSGAESANPYFRSMALAGANQALGSSSSYVSTQALGGSIQDLISGMGGDKFKALGISDEMVQKQIYDRAARALTGASMGSSKESLKLKGMIGGAKSSEDIINAILGSEGGVDLASAITEGTFFGDFASNKKFFGGLKMSGGAGAGDLKKIGGAAMAAEQTMASADVQFIAAAFKGDGAQKFSDVLKIYGKMVTDFANNPPPEEGRAEGAVNVLKSVESLVEAIMRYGGDEKVTEKVKVIKERLERHGKKNGTQN